MRVVQLGDQARAPCFRVARSLPSIIAAEIVVDAGPGQVLQMLLRGLARRHRLVRILVFELVERGKPMRPASAWSPRPPRASRGTAAPFRAAASGSVRHWPPAGGRRPRSWSSRGCRSARPAADGARDGGRAPRWSPSSGTLAACSASACEPRQPAPVVAAIEQACGQPDAIGAARLQPLREHPAHARRRTDAAAPAPEAGLRRTPGRSANVRRHSPFSIRVMSSPRLPRVSSWHSRP